MSSAKSVEHELPSSADNAQPGADVFVVHGADPEVQAYAMAKYSRSSLSMRESLRELNETKAEKFLNTFYFQYGHRSIADLAHIAMAIEKLSLLAATIVVDEQRWDGQERSTRYQDFKKSGYHVPKLGGNTGLAAKFRETIEFLFAEYREFSELMFQYLVSLTPKPEEMKQEAYERTLRARAFDITRYILPMATNTSLGQIVNARTLETQVSRLLSHTHAEVRELAAKMKAAAREPSYNVNHEAFRKIVDAIRERDESLGELAEVQLLREVKASPTLVKYAEPNQYEMATRNELQQAARELMGGATIESAPGVDLLDEEPLEIELATTLLYEHSKYPYRQMRKAVEGLMAARRAEIIDLGMRHRGKHDELLRAFSAGQKFRFDILMDIGGYRDMHRHRRCTQIAQQYMFGLGFETPPEISAAGHGERFAATMRRASEVAHALALELQNIPGAETGDVQYLIPLAYRKRSLFKMDFAEVVYISELRTTPAGHYSYRKVAWEMYETVAKRYPALARYFRVHDIHQPVDLLQR